MRQIVLSGILLLGTALPSFAQLSNGGFESGLTGWTLAGNVGRISSSFGKTPTEGVRAAYMISQATLVPGVTTAAAGGSNAGQVSAATLAAALGTTTTALNNAAGANHSATTGTGATGGSGIFQSFTVAANTTLFFDWNFMTTEDTVLNPTTHHNDFGFLVLNGQVTALGRVNQAGSDTFQTSSFHYIPFTGQAVDGSHIESFLFEVGDGTGNSTVRANDYNNNTATNFGATKFKRFGISFTTAQTVNLGFGVINTHRSGSPVGSTPSAFLVDNVRIVNGVIPEPGTLALLALGGLGGLVFLRRR